MKGGRQRRLSVMPALASSKRKAAVFKRAVKRMANRRGTSDTRLPTDSSSPSSSSSPSPARTGRKRRLSNLLRQQHPPNSAIQHLSVRPVIPVHGNFTTQNSDFALQVATTTVAIQLSIVLIAETIFLPFRTLLVQGIPLFLTMMVAKYLLLQILERVESESGRMGEGKGDAVVGNCKL